MGGLWLAALSGLIAGGTLLVGAAIAWYVNIPQRVVAGIMALGAGILISTLAFELVEEAARAGGLFPTSAGFLAGAVLYIVADWLVSRPAKRATGGPAAAGAAEGSTAGGSTAGGSTAGGSTAGGSVSMSSADGSMSVMDATLSTDLYRMPANIVVRRSTAKLAGGKPATGKPVRGKLPGGKLAGGAGVAIAIGALIDGIPESVVMGLSVLQGGISIPIVAAIAISNFPEGLGSTAALKRGGSGGRAVALLWCGIALVTVVASVAGFLVFQSAPASLVTLITTVAAGGLLAMICNTMIPEAFADQRALTGLWATLGFLGAFLLHELAG